jgi:hypothetical protein
MLKLLFVFVLALVGIPFAQAQIGGKSVQSFKTQAGITLQKGDTVRIGRGTGSNGSFRYIFIPSNAFTGTPQKFFTSNFAGSAAVIKDLKTTESSMYGIQTVAVIKGEGLLSGCIVINPAEEAGEIRTKSTQRTAAIGTASAPSGSVADELLKLKQLLDAKLITPAEFTTQKNKLLNQKSNTTSEGVITAAGRTQTADDISFKFISATGDRKNQTVTVIVLFTNKAANKSSFNTQVRSCTSVDGEEFALKSGAIGKDRLEKTLFTDAPIRGTYVFAGVLPKVTLIKVMPMPYYFTSPSSHFEQGQIELRDLTIVWK